MEYEIYRSVFPKDICNELISVISQGLSEKVECFGGQVLPRLQVNPDWAYNFYRLSKTESSKYCDFIKQVLPNAHISSFRIMHYPPGTKLGRHTDGSGLRGDEESNSGFIVQLNDPKSYVGGHLLMDSNIIDLEVGDGVFYKYSVPHEVKLVRKSDRWISNLRLMV